MARFVNPTVRRARSVHESRRAQEQAEQLRMLLQPPGNRFLQPDPIGGFSSLDFTGLVNDENMRKLMGEPAAFPSYSQSKSARFGRFGDEYISPTSMLGGTSGPPLSHGPGIGLDDPLGMPAAQFPQPGSLDLNLFSPPPVATPPAMPQAAMQATPGQSSRGPFPPGHVFPPEHGFRAPWPPERPVATGDIEGRPDSLIDFTQTQQAESEWARSYEGRKLAEALRIAKANTGELRSFNAGAPDAEGRLAMIEGAPVDAGTRARLIAGDPATAIEAQKQVTAILLNHRDPSPPPLSPDEVSRREQVKADFLEREEFAGRGPGMTRTPQFLSTSPITAEKRRVVREEGLAARKAMVQEHARQKATDRRSSIALRKLGPMGMMLQQESGRADGGLSVLAALNMGGPAAAAIAKDHNDSLDQKQWRADEMTFRSKETRRARKDTAKQKALDRTVDIALAADRNKALLAAGELENKGRLAAVQVPADVAGRQLTETKRQHGIDVGFRERQFELDEVATRIRNARGAAEADNLVAQTEKAWVDIKLAEKAGTRSAAIARFAGPFMRQLAATNMDPDSIRETTATIAGVTPEGLSVAMGGGKMAEAMLLGARQNAPRQYKPPTPGYYRKIYGPRDTTPSTAASVEAMLKKFSAADLEKQGPAIRKWLDENDPGALLLFKQWVKTDSSMWNWKVHNTWRKVVGEELHVDFERHDYRNMR